MKTNVNEDLGLPLKNDYKPRQMQSWTTNFNFHDYM